MNANHDDERLDELLGQWAEQSAAPDRLDELHDSIVTAAVEAPTGLNGHGIESSSKFEMDYPDHRTRRPSRWAAGFAVGSALMLLVSVTVFWFALQDRRSGASNDDLPPEFAWLRADQIQNKQVLLNEMDEMFGNQLAWLAETGDRVEFGLSQSHDESDEATTADEASRLAVRVVVERRNAANDDWQVAWAMDVVSRSEEFVEVVPQQADGNELRLWTYRLPSGLIAVDSELQLVGRNRLHATTSGLQKDGQPVRVFTSSDNGTEYRVYQTVAVLDGKVS